MAESVVQSIKKSIVFFGVMNSGKPQYSGTGFVIQVDKIFYVVTAKHVVSNNFANMMIFCNSNNFGINVKPISGILGNGFSWKSHQNPNVDIALLPFPIDLKNDKVKTVPNSLFVKKPDDIEELVNLFFLSYQPGINEIDSDSIDPIIRKGVISRLNHDKTFYMDGFAFPGNSGSPVFLLPTPIKMIGNNLQIGGPMEIKLAGIIGAYVPYQDVSISQQTGQISSISTENTGIAIVHSTLLLEEIINSPDFQEQHKRIVENVEKAGTNKSK